MNYRKFALVTGKARIKYFNFNNLEEVLNPLKIIKI